MILLLDTIYATYQLNKRLKYINIVNKYYLFSTYLTMLSNEILRFHPIIIVHFSDIS